MQTLYPENQLPSLSRPSIFLAWPTPRSPDVQSWRPEAIGHLEKYGFKGTVLVPERKDWIVQFDYISQVEWELHGLESCSVVVFWVPRDMDKMPSLTTNVEYGMLVKSGRIIYGRPDTAVHVAYLDYLYGKFAGKVPFNSLEQLMSQAAKEASNG